MERIKLNYDSKQSAVQVGISFMIKDGEEEDMRAGMRLTGDNGFDEDGGRTFPLHTHNLECVIAMLNALMYKKEWQAMRDGGEIIGG